MVAKGIVSDFQACEDLLLSMLKGAPKSTFKAAIEKRGCEIEDQFDSCMLALAKLLFSEECINHQTEFLRSARNPLDDTMQEFVSA